MKNSFNLTSLSHFLFITTDAPVKYVALMYPPPLYIHNHIFSFGSTHIFNI